MYKCINNKKMSPSCINFIEISLFYFYNYIYTKIIKMYNVYYITKLHLVEKIEIVNPNNPILDS